MKKILSITTAAGLFLLPLAAHAAVTIENIGGSLGLGNADLKTTVMNIITYVLGLLGLIAVIMILYGGFTWMTAGGNEDKVDTAKQIISSEVLLYQRENTKLTSNLSPTLSTQAKKLPWVQILC